MYFNSKQNISKITLNNWRNNNFMLKYNYKRII